MDGSVQFTVLFYQHFAILATRRRRIQKYKIQNLKIAQKFIWNQWQCAVAHWEGAWTAVKLRKWLRVLVIGILATGADCHLAILKRTHQVVRLSGIPRPISEVRPLSKTNKRHPAVYKCR